MDIHEAFEVVLAVAKANAILVPHGPERERLDEANKQVEDFVVNQLGDD